MNSIVVMDVVGFGITVFGFLLPAIFWARRVDSNVVELKDNHLPHVQETLNSIHDTLLAIKTILEERR